MNKHISSIRELFQFLKKPHYTLKKGTYSFGDKMISIPVLTIIILVTDSFLILPFHGLLTDAEIDQKMFEGLFHSDWKVIILILTLLPLIEELVFRFQLKFVVGSYVFYLIGLASLLIYVLVKFTNREHVSLFIFLLLCIVLILVLIRAPILQSSYKYRVFFIRYYPIHIWLSATLFAFVHIPNYNLYSTKAIILSPLLVLPQLFSGMVLSYTRLKFGMVYGILLHILHNTSLWVFMIIISCLS